MHQSSASLSPQKNKPQEANVLQQKTEQTHPAKQRPVQRMQGKKAVHQAKQRPVQRMQDYQTHPAKHQPVQRNKPQANDLKTQMGNQHGVDLSEVKEHQNSKFPGSVGAVATIQGKEIHYAPGQFTPQNRKHELGHAIDNTLNGTPKGDKVVNGHAIDTTREKAADKIADTPLQRKATDEQPTPAAQSQVIQRQVKWDKPNGGIQEFAGDANFGNAKSLVEIFKGDPNVVLISNKASKNDAIKDIKDTVLAAEVGKEGLLSTFLAEIKALASNLGANAVYGNIADYDELKAKVTVACLQEMYPNFEDICENAITRNGDFTNWTVWQDELDYLDMTVDQLLDANHGEHSEETSQIVTTKLNEWLTAQLLDGTDDKTTVSDFVEFAGTLDNEFGELLIDTLADNIAHHWIDSRPNFVPAVPDHAQLKADIIAGRITGFDLSQAYNTRWGPGAEFTVNAPNPKQAQYDQVACVHTHYDAGNNLTMAHAKLWHRRRHTGGRLQIIPLPNIRNIALAGAANGANQVGDPWNQL